MNIFELIDEMESHLPEAAESMRSNDAKVRNQGKDYIMTYQTIYEFKTGKQNRTEIDSSSTQPIYIEGLNFDSTGNGRGINPDTNESYTDAEWEKHINNPNYIGPLSEDA